LKTAVLLNGNAKRVGPRLVNNFRQLVPERDLYISSSLDEARAITAHLIEARYERIISGGGDGTFVQVVNDVIDRVRAANLSQPDGPALLCPQIGLLRLGTGNAVASLTGSSRPTRDLMRLRDGRVGPPIPIDMIVAEGRRFPFAGFGYDGELLNDYLWLKERVENPVLKKLFHSVAGYFMALGLKTIPRHMRGHGVQTTMRIIALDKAWYVDPLNQDAYVEHPPGAVLFEGSATVASVGSVPFYGYGMRVFPFAGQVPGTFQLRVASVGVLHVLANLGALWRGSYRNPQGCFDFICKRIRIESDAPLPYQVGGDGAGWRTELEFGVDDVPIPVVNMRPALTAARD
jgi:diacylglycerol kinase family enzyme